ncbi:proline dehydrogenase family protein [Candidatus Woesearchaeota archaeon]|nr:proline dehydrogenase family protein [Candidatus Woesearchaeota archaeon]
MHKHFLDSTVRISWKMSLLSRILTPFAKRFIAGERAEDAIRVAKALNEKGMKVTLDILGEDVKTEEEAYKAVNSYLSLLELINKEKVDANVSLKLTQLGLDLDTNLCAKNLEKILDKAKTYNNFVRIDMEGSAYTQKTLNIFHKLHQTHKNVGVVIQAYLFRSEKDIQDLIKEGCRVRLCKGAYKEPQTIAYKDKKDVDSNYIRLMEQLLIANNYPAIATHDEKIINHTKKFVGEHKIRNNSFEFQMLYGIRSRLQEKLANEGHNMRIYVPFGSHWLPYTVRRLRERKENILFVAKNLLKK